MKNILIITVVSFFSFSINAQKLGLEGKRFSAELNFSSNFYYPLVEAEKLFEMPQYRTKILINYTVARKHSVGLILSGSVYKMDSKFLDKRYQITNSKDKLLHYGIGIRHSIFVRDFISPVGSSFNYFIKRNKLFINNDGIGVTSIGFGLGYESRIFISSKIPIYMNYGFSSAFNFLLKGNDKFIETLTYKINGNSYNNNYNIVFMREIFGSEALEFNVGVGYIF